MVKIKYLLHIPIFPSDDVAPGKDTMAEQV